MEALARRPDLRFLHWEIEFPEVFFEFTGIAGQQIQHKDKIKPGTAGFDAIVGNPPYVRQETLKPLKPYLKANFQTYDSTNDLYVYFQEVEVRSLRANGRMGMIVANKWMRSGYGEPLRGYLRRVAQPMEVIDFGHSPIFPDADTFPCILLVVKRESPIAAKVKPPDDEQMVACQVPRDRWNNNMDLIVYVNTAHHLIPTRLLRDEGWSLERTEVQNLIEKIRRSGQTLREYVGSEIFRGVLTGYNAAFYLTPEVRRELIQRDPKSAELIKPQLRGQDVGRWLPNSEGVSLLFVRRGTDITNYPAVLDHLQEFKDKLSPKPANWDEKKNGKWPGRKSGPYEWFEIQDSTAYYPLFGLPKIVVQCIGYHSRWSLDKEGYFVNNKTFFIPSDDLVLLAILNSPLIWWYMWRDFPHMKDEALSIDGQCVERLPIPSVSQEAAASIRQQTEEVLRLVEQMRQLLSSTSTKIERLVGSVIPPKDLGDLTIESVVQRLKKSAGIRKISPGLHSDLDGIVKSAKETQHGFLQRQRDLEFLLAELVSDAYGLSAEEKQLVRETRPPRDPIDVLEARLQGQEIAEAEDENDGE